MKKLFSLLLICSISVSVFSQDLKSNNDLLAKYTNSDSKLYPIFDSCPNSNKIEGCWKIGLNWDVQESDYSLIHRSKMHFYYVPKSTYKCDNIASYELSPNSKTGGWYYKNQNISISVKMIGVETLFGYQLSEIRITNLKGESCFGPKSVVKKLY
jgi:hypothetical protein